MGNTVQVTKRENFKNNGYYFGEPISEQEFDPRTYFIFPQHSYGHPSPFDIETLTNLPTQGIGVNGVILANPNTFGKENVNGKIKEKFSPNSSKYNYVGQFSPIYVGSLGVVPTEGLSASGNSFANPNTF